jgi:hypothetical protein
VECKSFAASMYTCIGCHVEVLSGHPSIGLMENSNISSDLFDGFDLRRGSLPDFAIVNLLKHDLECAGIILRKARLEFLRLFPRSAEHFLEVTNSVAKQPFGGCERLAVDCQFQRSTRR